MARTEARIRCEVWRNRDFTRLPIESQGLYWMLLSQPDVSLAGVVPYNRTKWANLARGDLDEALAHLETSGFVMADPTTGELWIRTFTKHDGVLNGVKTRQGMWSAWTNILSVGIRERFLQHLDDEHEQEAVAAGWVSAGEIEKAHLEYAEQAQNALCDGVSDGVSEVGQDGVSHGVSPRAHAESASDTASDSDSDTTPSSADADVEDSFGRFWSAYPKGKAGKPGGDGARKPTLQKWRRLKPDERQACLVAVHHYRAHVESPDGPIAAHALTWLNQERWEQWQEPASRDGPARTHNVTPITQGGRF